MHRSSSRCSELGHVYGDVRHEQWRACLFALTTEQTLPRCFSPVIRAPKQPSSSRVPPRSDSTHGYVQEQTRDVAPQSQQAVMQRTDTKNPNKETHISVLTVRRPERCECRLAGR
jgi:predicted kinase